MRPRRTPTSNHFFQLPGGTEDNLLHCRVGEGYPSLDPKDPGAGAPYIAVVYEPEPEERAAISAGANVELVLLARRPPPLLMATTREQPTSRPNRLMDSEHARLCAELEPGAVLALMAAIDALDGVPAQGIASGPLGELDGETRALALGNLETFRTQLEVGLADLKRIDDEAER